MLEIAENLYETISGFDLIYLIITFFSLIKCARNGFVLSLLSALKWLLAYVVTLVLFPKTKPYFKDLINNDYKVNTIMMDNYMGGFEIYENYISDHLPVLFSFE